MKQFCYKTWVKVCAVILCIISFNFAAGSLVVMMLVDQEDVYESTQEAFRDQVYEKICMNYSIAAIACYQDDFGMEKLKDTNFRYGVIQADNIDGLDLNDKKIYEVCNFDREIAEDQFEIHSFSMGESTGVYVGDSLFDSFYIYNHEASYTEKRSIIQKCYYARDTDRFYCLADGKLYDGEMYDVMGYAPGDGIVSVSGENGEIIYAWADSQDQVEFDGQIWRLSDIPIVLQKDLYDIGTVVSNLGEEENYEEYYIQDGYVVSYVNDFAKTTPYYVISYVNTPLKENGAFLSENIFGKLGNWSKQDFFVQAEALIQGVYSIRYTVFVIFFVSLFLCIFFYIVLLVGAGHHNAKEITQTWIDKIPYDVLLAAMMVIGSIQIVVEIESIRYMSIWPEMFFSGCFICIAAILFLVLSMTTAVRLKLGGWWKNTLCFRIWALFKKTLKNAIEKLGRTVPMIGRAWAVMGALAFFEFLGLVSSSGNTDVQVFLWLAEKIILYVLITIALLQMKKLQQAGEQLAAGGLKSRLDTERMIWDFKQHGENLNHIQEGIQRAVAEQMKSERFKTELITNVSHDIKTPLTSIINYVDLLEKEEIDNQNVKEYLEVLGRQSARLKKLIEDLMEASKASTGNLTVTYECCDVQVMLTQTIGEFEEKLKVSRIELLVQDSDTPLFIQADPRHLWRIFENLMNNICKYAQPSTRAYVNIENSGQSVRIIFRNISKYALNISSDELMERFVRGDSSRNTEGSGLGLSIAKSLTDLMQGVFELVVDGDLFKVIVTFPVAKQEDK